MSAAPLRLAIAGFGSAARAFLPALREHGGFALTGIADPDAGARAAAAAETGVPVWASLAELLERARPEVVYVATPTPLHAAHVAEVVAAGRHVLVEKPMAAKLADARAMAAAAQAAGVICVVGHSFGFDAPVRAMRELIAGGSLGRLRMVHTWCYTDWMYRPRRPEELDAAQGGGVTYRQGAHQFDILRVLGGGLVERVRARTFDWDAGRRGIGAHTVWLDFADGAVATAVYNGYGGFSSMDLCFDIDELGMPQPAAGRAFARRPLAAPSAADEAAAKARRARGRGFGPAPYQPFFGLTLASCEGGDVRQVPEGLQVHAAAGVRTLALPAGRNPRGAVLDELHDAIRGIRPALHDARWGVANLEVCEAAIASSRANRAVRLRHQVAVPE